MSCEYVHENLCTYMYIYMYIHACAYTCGLYIAHSNDEQINKLVKRSNVYSIVQDSDFQAKLEFIGIYHYI